MASSHLGAFSKMRMCLRQLVLPEIGQPPISAFAFVCMLQQSLTAGMIKFKFKFIRCDQFTAFRLFAIGTLGIWEYIVDDDTWIEKAANKLTTQTGLRPWVSAVVFNNF